MIYQMQKIFIFCIGFLFVVYQVNDRTLVASVETVGLFSLFDRAAGSKSDRRNNASATPLSRPGLYFMEN